jgi:hypothetical protein
MGAILKCFVAESPPSTARSSIGTRMKTSVGSPGSTVVALPRPHPTETPSVSVHIQQSGPWQVIAVDAEMDIQVLPLLPDLRGAM